MYIYPLETNISRNVSRELLSFIDPNFASVLNYSSPAARLDDENLQYRFGAFVYSDLVYQYISINLANVNISELNTSGVNVSAAAPFLKLINVSDSQINQFVTDAQSAGLDWFNFTNLSPSDVTVLHNSTSSHAAAMFNGDIIEG